MLMVQVICFHSKAGFFAEDSKCIFRLGRDPKAEFPSISAAKVKDTVAYYDFIH